MGRSVLDTTPHVSRIRFCSLSVFSLVVLLLSIGHGALAFGAALSTLRN